MQHRKIEPHRVKPHKRINDVPGLHVSGSDSLSEGGGAITSVGRALASGGGCCGAAGGNGAELPEQMTVEKQERRDVSSNAV